MAGFDNLNLIHVHVVPLILAILILMSIVNFMLS